ncbi:MAG: DMT family transporter [Gemmatimonadota bacterium]|nr:DMT family transporter [Gemmatimonadota bacterium]MDH3426912.1 DMT family transporter [Gemmatimonadota bacterium]
MTTLLLALAIAFVGGLAIGLQSPLASMMSQRIGSLESAFVVHLGGALIASIPLLVMGGGHLSKWREVPAYALLSGGLGLVLIAAISYSIPRIGLANTVAPLIAAQLVAGAVLDHFGLLGLEVRLLDPARAVGLGLLLAGVWLVTK